jgi:acetoin utilization deacetylase AcuC-like enzyme
LVLAQDDHLAQTNLKDDDFGWVQREIMKVALDVCGGKVVSVLEGGYNLEAIARSAVECVRAQCDAIEDVSALRQRARERERKGGGRGGEKERETKYLPHGFRCKWVTCIVCMMYVLKKYGVCVVGSAAL